MQIRQLRKLIRESNTLREVVIKLGFTPTNTTQRNNIKEAIKIHSIDISHFGNNRYAISSRWKNEDKIKTAAKQASSIGTFLTIMGLKNVGSNYKTAKYHLKRFNVDTSHFNRSGKRKNKSLIPLSEILEGKHPSYDRTLLKKRLLKEGIKENKCKECNQTDIWNGKELKMQLDHIDGCNDNHALKNLRMICPNCHTQTETYAGKNKNKIISLIEFENGDTIEVCIHKDGTSSILNGKKKKVPLDKVAEDRTAEQVKKDIKY